MATNTFCGLVNSVGVYDITMERFLVLTSVFLHAILVNFPTEAIVAKHCDPRACLLPSCRCSNTEIPGGVHVRDAPQFVILTFDDAVTQINSEFYKQAFDNRTNPDGCPVSATYFVSHEYTDYTKVSSSKRSNFSIFLTKAVMVQEINCRFGSSGVCTEKNWIHSNP
jgi:hypothetical protein